LDQQEHSSGPPAQPSNPHLFLAALGPGIITMIADNDAGGISTYAQTGAKTGFNLLWAMIILCRWRITCRR
jgi:Mn2+/Fe2+ NRAMP family transporter